MLLKQRGRDRLARPRLGDALPQQECEIGAPLRQRPQDLGRAAEVQDVVIRQEGIYRRVHALGVQLEALHEVLLL